MREDRDEKPGLREVGAAVGIEPTRLSRLETGNTQRGITSAEIVALAGYYGISTDYILRGTDAGTTELMERVRAAHKRLSPGDRL